MNIIKSIVGDLCCSLTRRKSSEEDEEEKRKGIGGIDALATCPDVLEHANKETIKAILWLEATSTDCFPSVRPSVRPSDMTVIAKTYGAK